MTKPTDAADRRPRGTSTKAFGTGKRESHDASAFYRRFDPPVLDTSDDVRRCDPASPAICADSRSIPEHLEPNSVALVVTSPPYFVGKEYEEALGRGVIPASYQDYLQMLEEVFAACVEVMEPGARIAVNVANLGRRPYRSLSGDVVRIFERLGLWLRGEVLWRKAEGATGSCAWGSYRSARNPVLRDLTERVVIASKGRFDRALTAKQRAARDLPHRSTITADEFMEATLDLWDIPPESAKRVGHPAPFPVALPQRLIEMYTFEDDLVLDPFLGAGTTLVAAERSGRRGVGFDTDEGYCDLAMARLDAERRRRAEAEPEPFVVAPEPSGEGDEPGEALGVKLAKARIEQLLLDEAGFRLVKRNPLLKGSGVRFGFELADQAGGLWMVEASGAFSRTDPWPGLRRADAVLKALGKAALLRSTRGGELRPPRLLMVTSHLPEKGPARQALKAAGPDLVHDVLCLTDADDRARLARYAAGRAGDQPQPGFWTPAELGA